MSTRKKNGKAKPLSPEAEKKRLYAAMVAAVREWLAVEHPRADDRVDIALYGSWGSGDTVATFHAESEYLTGDLMAMDLPTET